jgi:hypothetical protein
VRETTINIGLALQNAMRAIEKANPDTLQIKGVRVILNKLYSYLLIKRGWFNGEKTTSF